MSAPVETVSGYPARLRGGLDESHLSRGLWLVKWLLAIPHYVVLLFLWIGFVFATVAAAFVILFTGRYPRAIFDYNVGVLRWTWRVQYYSWTVLGSDRYPPFTLRATDYPADVQVEYPENLSRGLVVVKWWLLVIPHYLLVAAMTGSGWDNGEGSTGISLLGVLVLVAAVALLFTGRYPRSLFDFVLGINRWVFRVIVYAALMRDEYPPFRLDQGPDEPWHPRQVQS
ncbi:MAG: DUF4389 domain-containing protein [Mycobacteriaceae bacterium]|nr:DUF4389 domain-containing protein [Mycobacteriaceae bacterium]